jgi:predicted RNA binding protein YcfA (HicA-like mRNA interferase family)
MNAKQVIKILVDDGWYLHKSKGSHRQFKHPNKKGKVTVAFHGNIDLAEKTLKSIFNQANIKF